MPTPAVAENTLWVERPIALPSCDADHEPTRNGQSAETAVVAAFTGARCCQRGRRASVMCVPRQPPKATWSADPGLTFAAPKWANWDVAIPFDPMLESSDALRSATRFYRTEWLAQCATPSSRDGRTSHECVQRPRPDPKGGRGLPVHQIRRQTGCADSSHQRRSRRPRAREQISAIGNESRIDVAHIHGGTSGRWHSRYRRHAMGADAPADSLVSGTCSVLRALFVVRHRHGRGSLWRNGSDCGFNSGSGSTPR